MRMLLLVSFFACFGFAWPVFIANNTRGRIMFLTMIAPWAAFWLGWLAR